MTVTSTADLHAILKRRVYAKGDFIWRKGDTGNFACIVRSGSVHILKESNHGRDILTTVGPGQLFGEFALINGGKRTATAVAAEMTEVMVISNEQFQAKMAGTGVFMRYWLDYLMKRVVDLSARIE